MTVCRKVSQMQYIVKVHLLAPLIANYFHLLGDLRTSLFDPILKELYLMKLADIVVGRQPPTSL